MAQTRRSLQDISELLQEIQESSAAGVSDNADEEVYRAVENITEICMTESSTENTGNFMFIAIGKIM